MAFGLDAKKKSHRHRKNPRSYELYREENKRQNDTRPKQRWVPFKQIIDNIGHTVVEGGYWTREAA